MLARGPGGFVVGENHGAGRYTRIHRLSCSFAGPGGHRTMNTRWHPLSGGTYATYAGAHRAAEDCGQDVGPYDCEYCRPQLHDEAQESLERLAGATSDDELQELSIRKIAESLVALQQVVRADQEVLAQALSLRRAEPPPPE